MSEPHYVALLFAPTDCMVRPSVHHFNAYETDSS